MSTPSQFLWTKLEKWLEIANLFLPKMYYAASAHAYLQGYGLVVDGE